jgi:ABC-2 type transport system permease protein
MKKIKSFLNATSEFMKDEIKIIFSDPGAILIFIVAILVYTVIYSYAYNNEVVRENPVALVDLDYTAASRQYARLLDAGEEIRVTCKPASLAEAEDLFYAGRVNGIVLISAGFEAQIMKGEQTTVPVYCDAGYFLMYKQVYSGVVFATVQLNRDIKTRLALIEGQPAVKATTSSDPLTLISRNLFNPMGGYGSFVMPGIILVILQQTMLIGIGLLGGTTRERNFYNHASRLETTRGGAWAAISGKGLAYLLIGSFTSVYGLGWIYHWFQFPDKSGFLLVTVILVPFLLSTAFLGLTISVLFRERVDALMFMVFLSPVVLFLTGLSWPTQCIPGVLNALAKIFPTTLMVPAYVRVRSMGAGLSDIMHEMSGLWGLTILYFFSAVAAWNYSRKQFLKRRVEVVKHCSRYLAGDEPGNFHSDK